MTDDVRINPLTGRPISAVEVLDDPEFKAFAARVVGELVPKIEASGVSMILVPKGDIDVKFAVELGVSIMLNKPIIAVIPKGMPIPEKLAAVADHVVEMPKNFAKDKTFERDMLAAMKATHAQVRGAMPIGAVEGAFEETREHAGLGAELVARIYTAALSANYRRRNN